MDVTENAHDVTLIKARLLEKMGENASEYPVHIELQFPRILSRIADLWGTAELDSFLSELMLPQRQDRQGFPADVAIELFHLASVHGALGFNSKTAGSGWSSAEEVAWDKSDEGRRK